MSKKYSIQATEYSEDISMYLSISVNDINPVELEKELDVFKRYILTKYFPELYTLPEDDKITSFKKKIKRFFK